MRAALVSTREYYRYRQAVASKLHEAMPRENHPSLTLAHISESGSADWDSCANDGNVLALSLTNSSLINSISLV
jgi:hypothetical protein